MKRLKGMVLVAAAVAIGYGRPHIAEGIGEDELQCEDAMAHLASCCPGFEPRFHNCSYTDGCPGAVPDLTEPQSTTIRSLSGEQLVSGGFCSNPSHPDPATGDE